MEQWPNLCLAGSAGDLSCSKYALSSALGFLPEYGITDLNEATEDQIQRAFH